MQLSSSFECVFQNLMHLSAVPPPLARRPLVWGDQAKALTAAKCEVNLQTGSLLFYCYHTRSLLSFPPDASCCSSYDHFSPHTSYLWLWRVLILSPFSLKSLIKIFLSLEPEARTFEDHAIVPTLPSWPLRTLVIFPAYISHTWTSPLFVPMLRWCPLFDQHTEVTQSLEPKSWSFVTLELLADQM